MMNDTPQCAVCTMAPEIDNPGLIVDNSSHLHNVSQDNRTASFEIPSELLFSDDRIMPIAIYCVLFFIASVGNLTVFITLFRNRHRKSRVNLFIMHLAIADMIVTFVMLPLEMIWLVTVEWKAGDIACRVLMFFRAFGLYLSSFILVTICLDRYFAILHPLSMNDADRRGKLMLSLAWLFSGVASLPQSVIFHLEIHPKFPWFTQCVTFNFFPTPAHELAYNLFNLVTVYGMPLLVIIIAYTIIICEMTKKSRESKEDTYFTSSQKGNRERLRRSGVGKIERARIRTLRMTIMIVLVFVMCWTPYFVISAWWWFDKESADKVDPKVQRGLFMFAVSNSCMDPIVYGIFSLDFKREFKRCCCCLAARARQEEVASRIFRQTSFYKTTQTSMPSNFGGVSPAVKKNGPYTACKRISCIVEDSGASDSGAELSNAKSNGPYTLVELEMKGGTYETTTEHIS